MFLTVGGNLIIGSGADAGYKLDVSGTLRVTGAAIFTSNVTIRPSTGYNAYFQVNGTVFRTNYLNDALTTNISASYRAEDFTWQNNLGQQRIKLFTSGNLIIGVDDVDSGYKLEVLGTGRFSGNLTLTGTYADLQNSTYIRFSNTGGATRWGYIQHDGTNMAFTNDISGGIFTFNNTNSITKTKAGSGVESLSLLDLRLAGTAAIGDALNINFIVSGVANIAKISGIAGEDNVAYGSLAFSIRNYNTDAIYEAMRINNRGNVGIGTTSPTTYSLAGTHLEVFGGSNFSFIHNNTTTVKSFFASNESALLTALFTFSAHPLTFGTSNTERMRITSAGNVGIGTNTPTAISGFTSLTINNATNGGIIDFQTNGTGVGRIINDATTFNILALGASNSLLLGTNGSEKVRITSAGFTKCSNYGGYYGAGSSYHELGTNSSGNWNTVMFNTSGSPYGLYIPYTGASPNSTGSEFLYLADSTTLRFSVRSNGGIANFQANDSNLSDERTKKDIIPLESYWDKFKAIEIVKFKYKDQTHDDFNIGVIAQQVEAVAPEFVDVDGWGKPKLDEEGNEIVTNEEPLKSIYTSDLHHTTIKVLQECMAKIEEQQTQIEELKQLVAIK
jgi:hypothetical protein